GRGIAGLEAVLVRPIDREGDGADGGLADEPPEVFLAVNHVHAADEQAPEEEAEDADGDHDAAVDLAEPDVSEAGKDKGEESGHGLEGFEVIVRRAGGHGTPDGGPDSRGARWDAWKAR